MSSEKSFTPFHSNIPTKSESMPVLKSTFSLEDTMEDTIVITSESSLARQRKMKMIVARIDPLLSSGSSQSLATVSDGSRTELTEENYQAKKLESRTALPVLQDTACDTSHRLKEVTFHEPPEDKDFSSQRSQSSERKRIKSPRLATRDTEQQENGDLIDIAENPHPSIKSFYFPPSPEKEVSSASLRTQSRVKDLDTALRIIDELHPLQYQLNEILGQFRALSLANPTMLSQRHHSTQCTPMSSYYFHRTETFDRDADVNGMHLVHRQVIDESQDVRSTFGVGSFHPSSNQMALRPSFYTESQMETHNVDPRGSSSRCIERNMPSEMSNWTAENESQITLNNFHFQFGQFVAKDPSGSLIPSVSSTCYRCHRNRAHTFSHYDDAAGCSTSNRDGLILSAFSGMMHQPSKVAETMMEPNSSSENAGAAWTHTSQVDAKHSERPRSSNSRYSNISFRCPPERSFSSLKSIVSDISRLSKTQFVNSQTISKKEQTGHKEGHRSSRVTKRKRTKDKKAVKDLDVQCSGLNLKRQKEIVLRQSMESLLKPSPSEESNVSASSHKSKSIQVATDEKVVVVPIIFTDGVPEPKLPMFAVARSRTHLHNVKCHVMNVKKEMSSVTQSSLTSVNSSESYKRSLKDRSKMSVSCVSRPSLRCRNESHVTNTMKTLSDHHRSDKLKMGSMASGYTQSTKAHSEPTKKAMKKIMYGMRSSPEDFAFDT
ncbi:uncharacterized protein LOC143265979 isoform X2 [Megachile rotundata]